MRNLNMNETLLGWSLSGFSIKPKVALQINFTRFFLGDISDSFPKKCNVLIRGISYFELHINSAGSQTRPVVKSIFIHSLDNQIEIRIDFNNFGICVARGSNIDDIYWDLVNISDIAVEERT